MKQVEVIWVLNTIDMIEQTWKLSIIVTTRHCWQNVLRGKKNKTKNKKKKKRIFQKVQFCLYVTMICNFSFSFLIQVEFLNEKGT